MIAPSCEGVEVYGTEYATALARSKAGMSAIALLTDERLDKLIGSLYKKGYFVAQAYERESLLEMSRAFLTNQTIIIERMDLFGKLRFLKPAEALTLMLEHGAAEGLPTAFLGHQFQRLVDDFYHMGIVVVWCAEEPERKWFEKWWETKRRNPVFRLRSGPQKPAAPPAAPVSAQAPVVPATAAVVSAQTPVVPVQAPVVPAPAPVSPAQDTSPAQATAAPAEAKGPSA